MRNPSAHLTYFWLIFVIISLACNLTPNFAAQPTPKSTRPRHYVVVRPLTPTAVPGLSELVLPEPATPSSLTVAPAPIHRPRPTATPTPDNFAGLLADMLRLFNEPGTTPTNAPRLVMLPTLLPTPTDTAIFIATATPLPTETPTIDIVMPTPPPPTLTPTSLPVPVEAPLPAPTIEESTFSSPTNPPPPVLAPTEVVSTFSSPVNPPAQPSPAAVAVTADSGYDFLLGEFYNSPTTNSILVIYVAIVDPNEIPIGDIKVVGTRLDHNLTYDSPLSTWHYEGYNAPGEVVKSGNVKFEPPSGMETTNWVLHLEDPNGKRLSEDVPFDTDSDNKQWYFIKFKRKF